MSMLHAFNFNVFDKMEIYIIIKLCTITLDCSNEIMQSNLIFEYIRVKPSYITHELCSKTVIMI